MALLGLVAIGVNWSSALLGVALGSRRSPSRTPDLVGQFRRRLLVERLLQLLDGRVVFAALATQLGQLETGVGVDRQIGEGRR